MKLKTKRLIIRDPTLKDAKDLARNINNLQVSKWLLLVPYPYKLKDAKWYINHCKEKAKKRKRESYSFSIELKSEHRIIGGIAINKIDYFQGTATIGYWLGQDYWRNGYGSEALKALIDFAFKKLKLRRLEARVLIGNPSSGKLLEKYGFKKEGYSRKACVSKADGKIHDEYIYGLLRNEWRRR